MTVKELSQRNRLERDLEKDRRHLEELEWDAAAPPLLRQYGRISDEKSSADLAREIVELKKAIAEKRLRCIQEEKRLWLSISETKDVYTRLIFKLRFIWGLSWEAVADEMYGTAEGMRKRCYRHIKPP
ncbi:MAG: hypothetical protein LUD12_05820 [Lachnospiraceae bacterium]|nr:hypothetical protein [Lachnospiraceae bacterium]